MGAEQVVGCEAVRRHLAAWPVDSCRWDVAPIASHGDLVLTERMDRFVYGDDRIVIPAMGALAVSDGRITRWRDYFDRGAMKPQARS